MPYYPPADGTVEVVNFPETQTVDGTVNVTDNGGSLTVDGPLTDAELRATPVPVSTSALPLPTGAATAAKQPALGTAGSASADVLTVQGIASMTALKVDGSAVTQPVSGTVAVSNFPAAGLTDAELRASAVPVSFSASDTTATGTINSGAATVSIACAGCSSVSAQVAAGGTLAGNLGAQYTVDGGTTWIATPWLDSPVWGGRSADALSGTTGATRGILVPGGASHVRVVVSSYSSGSCSITLRASTLPTAGTVVQTVDSAKPTYSCTNTIPLGTNATDVFTLWGSASKTIRVTRLTICGTQTTAGTANFQIIKRSTANGGGTTFSGTMVPYDSANPAATASVVGYTANATGLGTQVGLVFAGKIFLPAPATASEGAPIILEYGTRNSQSIVLRGTTQGLCFNFAGVTPAGASVAMSFEWTEE